MPIAFSQNDYLTILTHAPSEAVKAVAETLLATLGQIEVLLNRTGLVMLPYTDNAQGSVFHLGEVLIAEAHLQLDDGTQGYAQCLGRDQAQAIAIAVIDAALQAKQQPAAMVTLIEAFLTEQHAIQLTADDRLLRAVEQTRIEMQTF